MTDKAFNIVLYQPEIPGNTGTIIRMAACLEFNLHIIEPMGFLFDSKKIKRSMMDYYDYVNIKLHKSFDDFLDYSINKRLILLDTKGEKSCWDFSFQIDDFIIMGSESDGVPNSIFEICHEKVKIPINKKTRSLNLAVASSIICGEIRRQYPK